MICCCLFVIPLFYNAISTAMVMKHYMKYYTLIVSGKFERL
jgi:hypothetical protein